MAKFDKTHKGYYEIGASILDNFKQQLTGANTIKEQSFPVEVEEEDDIWLYISANAESENVEFLIMLKNSPRATVQKNLVPKSRLLEMSPEEFEEYFNSVTIPFGEQVAREREADAQKAQNR